MKKSILALAASLALVPLSAAASPAPMRTPPPGVFAVAVLQSREDKVGDRYRFVSRTAMTVTGEGARVQKNRQVFDLEVLAVRPETLTLRYTLVEGELTDTSDKDGNEVLQAWVGIPVLFEADRSGVPLRITNWPEVQQAFLAAFMQRLPARGDMRASIERYYARLGQNPNVLAMEHLGDVLKLAGMQLREPVKFGRVDLPVEEVDQNGRKLKVTRMIDVAEFDQAACEARVIRESRFEFGAPGAQSSVLKTEAKVSAYDGWVLSLSEVETNRMETQTQEQKLTIERLSAPAACPAKRR